MAGPTQHKPKELDVNETANKAPKTGTIDMKLEIVVVPVSDVDRATYLAANPWI